ncbi:hypothetical protein AK812_SmicGene44692, partial [Symbiodinium microadriaticum]
MAWLRVVNAIALAGWTWLLLHSVLPTCSGLVARDELAGQGLRVAIIAYRSMKGVEQTVLGLGICVFRTTIAVFAIPKLDNAALNQVLLGGWALADVLRYIALLSKRPSLQLLRRIASAILFLVVATAEVWASWLTFDSLTLGVRRWMVVQMCVTTMGLPVGAHLFLKSARPEQQEQQSSRAAEQQSSSTSGQAREVAWDAGACLLDVREAFKRDFQGEKVAVLAPPHGHVPIYRPRLPGALCRGSKAELPALPRPERSLWPHLEELVRMTEVPIGLPGTLRARSLSPGKDQDQAAQAEAEAEVKDEERSQRQKLPSFDAEAALRALREERLERERRCRFLDFPRGRPLGLGDCEGTASSSEDLRSVQAAQAAQAAQARRDEGRDREEEGGQGFPGRRSSRSRSPGNRSAMQGPEAPSLFARAEARILASLRPGPREPREPACSFVMRPPVVEWEMPSRPERERTAHRRPSA